MPIDKYQVSLKVFLKDSEGRVLLLRNPDDDMEYSGYYDLPGGRINTDEFNTPLMDILRREINEELGDIKADIDPRPVSLTRSAISGPSGEIRILYVLHEGKYLGGEIKLSSEHQSLLWIKPDEIDVKKFFKPIHHNAMNSYFKK